MKTHKHTHIAQKRILIQRVYFPFCNVNNHWETHDFIMTSSLAETGFHLSSYVDMQADQRHEAFEHDDAQKHKVQLQSDRSSFLLLICELIIILINHGARAVVKTDVR